MIVLPAATAIPARPACADIRARSRADRRQVEAPVLAGLGRLDQNADALRGRHASLAAQIGKAKEQIVGAFGRLNRKHMVVGDDHGLTDVERPHCRNQIKRARNI